MTTARRCWATSRSAWRRAGPAARRCAQVDWTWITSGMIPNGYKWIPPRKWQCPGAMHIEVRGMICGISTEIFRIFMAYSIGISSWFLCVMAPHHMVNPSYHPFYSLNHIINPEPMVLDFAAKTKLNISWVDPPSRRVAVVHANPLGTSDVQNIPRFLTWKPWQPSRTGRFWTDDFAMTIFGDPSVPP